jgi:hypothetical protein
MPLAGCVTLPGRPNGAPGQERSIFSAEDILSSAGFAVERQYRNPPLSEAWPCQAHPVSYLIISHAHSLTRLLISDCQMRR